jgi:glycosyltransferase involved in cell wall biosynthesis
VQIDCEIVDVYQWAPRSDPAYVQSVDGREASIPSKKICIYHLNGDEVEPCVAALEKRGFNFDDHVNIAMPAWELPIYPAEWADKLKRFDACWSISQFVQAALTGAGLHSLFVGQSAEVAKRSFLPRRHFGIRESAFACLHFFDTSSYVSRKNPEAAIETFRQLREARPFDDLQLVLKVKGDLATDAFIERLAVSNQDVVLINEQLSSYRTQSLIRCCDAFLSLHRAEGYGRGLGEAMSLGRLAVGTGWSGNMDFMTADGAITVDYGMIAVRQGEYPHGAGNEWAEPNPYDAALKLRRLIDSPADLRRMTARGSRDLLHKSGDRAVGLRAFRALEQMEVIR